MESVVTQPKATVAPTVEHIMRLAYTCENRAYQLIKGSDADSDIQAHRDATAALKEAVEALAVDAERWQQLRSFADPSYNVRAVSHEGSASLRQEHFCTVTCGTWDSLEASLDAVRYATVKGDA
jgi:hypothetical protein